MLIIKDHFNELKYRIFYCLLSILFNFCVCLCNSSKLTFIVAKPYILLIKSQEFDFIFMNIIEILEISLIISIYFCLFTNSPICFYYIYNFLKPGLYNFEKIFLFYFLILFVANIYFSFICFYFFIFPLSLMFFFSLNLIQNSDFLLVKLTLRLTEYVYVFIRFICFFSLFVFQIPLLFYLLNSYFNVRCYFLFKKRKIFIVFYICICFLFSPPDLISFLFFVLILILLTEFSLFFFIIKECYFLNSIESCLNGKRLVC